MLVHRLLLRLAGDVRREVAVGAAVGLALFAVRVASAVVVGLVLAAVLDRPGALDLTGAVVALALVVVLRSGLVWLREVVAARSAERVKERIRVRLLDRLVDLGPGWVARHRSGAVQATVVDGVEALEAYYARYLPQLVVALAGPPLVVAWVAGRSLLLGAVIGLCVLVVPLAPRLWDRLLTERGKEHWGAYERLGADYGDAMGGMTTLKAFDAVAARRAVLVARAEHLNATTMRQMAVSLVDTGLTALGAQAGTALTVLVGVFAAARGDLDVVTLAVVLVLAAECFRPFTELSAQWHAGFLGVSAADGIAAVLDARPPSPDRPDAVPLVCDGPVEVRFDGVTVTYPGRSRPAVEGLDLVVPAGTTVAVVGASGAGKTTLTGLLLRMFDPDAGRVLVAGQDVAGVTASSLRRSVAVAPQDAFLFHGSVAENLRLARPDATDDELAAACRAAALDDVLERLPDGLDTVVGDRGATLSGGERQRVTLARALLQDAPVLVLDEATSAVDARTEARIVDAVARLRSGRTTLVVAHRLSTVRGADRVAVLREGRVVETGAPDTLAAAGGAFAALMLTDVAEVGA